MNIITMLGIVVAVVLIAGLAIHTGAKTINDETNDNNAAVIAGVIMGTLVGGSSTVGTAQLAYDYGFSAWWFTLGGGIACFILGLLYVKPLRRGNNATLVGMIRDEYGPTAGISATLLNSLGTFINIISQLLAASAVVLIVFPEARTVVTVLIAAFFMVLYVVFGGTKGAGIVGILKLALLYISMVACGLTVLKEVGGITPFIDMVGLLKEKTNVNYFSVFCRGFRFDFGSCMSLVFGVLTTQTYAQGVLSGRSDQAARLGAFVSALMIPPIGIFGIMVGLYMRSVTDSSTFIAKTALTQFVLTQMPDFIGGIVLGTLFIASVGTGAGLALGIATVIRRDLIQKISSNFQKQDANGLLQKILIVIILICASALSSGALGDTILNFAFMSMGLRGATVFAPLCFILWGKRKVSKGWATVSIIVGPVVVLLFQTVPILNSLLNGWNSLFPGIISAVFIMALGYMKARKDITYNR
ncbi:sodium:solute symporter [Peptococcus simiae]|uniref:sodium:solute symporter family protein n=1 Tax=Peptococcus simiae TaxID=1643805 RepID=UPI00397EDF89